MNDQALQAALEPIVREAFGGFPVETIAVVPARDHDGDAVINVDIRLGSAARKYGSDQLTGLTRRILAALRETDDARFPLIWVHYPSDEPVEDFYPDEKRRKRG